MTDKKAADPRTMEEAALAFVGVFEGALTGAWTGAATGPEVGPAVGAATGSETVNNQLITKLNLDADPSRYEPGTATQEVWMA